MISSLLSKRVKTSLFKRVKNFVSEMCVFIYPKGVKTTPPLKVEEVEWRTTQRTGKTSCPPFNTFKECPNIQKNCNSVYTTPRDHKSLYNIRRIKILWILLSHCNPSGHFLKPLKSVLGLPKWKFLLGKSISCREKRHARHWRAFHCRLTDRAL